MNDTAAGAKPDICNMTGTYFHNVDTKGRINFPAKLREQLGETFWVSRGTADKCLTVYSQEGWQDVMRQIGGLKGTAAEKLRRWICSGAAEVTPDKQGRILIPPALRRFAGLDEDREVVVLGAGRKAEIWSSKLWNEMEDAFDPSADGVLEELCL